MMGFIIKALSSSFGPWIVGGGIALLMASGVYLRWSGYNAGYDHAEAKAAQQREAAKDDVLQQILDRQKEVAEIVKENRRINGEINNEVRKESETIETRTETIIREVPVYINRDTCQRGYTTVQLYNSLATAGSSDSARASTVGATSGTDDDMPEDTPDFEYLRRAMGEDDS